LQQKSVGPTEKHIDPAVETVREQRQKELESSAAKRVKHWHGIRQDDYDFRSWTKGARKERLQAGCIYEYARESRKLRCLLVMMNRKPEACDIHPLFHKPVYSFEDLHEYDARRALGEWFNWLANLADDLAENISFAKLLSAKSDELARAFRSWAPDEFFRAPAVKLASKPMPFSALGAPITTLDTSEGERVCYDGSEVIALRVRWCDFTDKEIGEEMKKFAARQRPADENCNPPRKPGQRPGITIQSYLKALSVLRIWKHERNRWKRLNLVAKVCGYQDCVRESTAYRERRKRWLAMEPMSNRAKVEMSNARGRALRFFQDHFPTETPANY
jgi:hypothetical protein